MSLYLQYKMYNKSEYPIDSFYFSFFAEPNFDVGLPACDTLDDLFMFYSGLDSIQEFGDAPPAIGCKIIHGLLTPSQGETAKFEEQDIPDYTNLGMSSLVAYHTNTPFPSNPIESEWAISGLENFSGDPYVYEGDTLTYFYSGDPVADTGDLVIYSAPYDVWQSCGPVQFLPGDSQYVLLKISVGQGENRLESIESLREILNIPYQLPTAVGDGNKGNLPERFKLHQNYPNPFNPSTSISFSLTKRSQVKLEVINILGQVVTTIHDGRLAAGIHDYKWDGSSFASGLYLYRLTAGDFVETKKMMLLK